MTTPSFVEALQEVPPFIRADLFKTKTRYPAAFLSSLAKSAPFVFRDMDTEQTDEAWGEIKNHFETLRSYAHDFFEKDKDGFILVPDHVYEVFAVLCNAESVVERTEQLSDKAKAMLAEINKLRWDPYPRQADYASTEARFLFLVMSFINSSTYASFYAATPAPREGANLFYYGFLAPMRTLDERTSDLEHDILKNLQRIEFMLDFEEHPYFAEHLRFIRNLDESALKAEDMLKRLGLPVTARLANTLILANTDFLEHGLIDADKTLALLICSYAHTKVLMECAPDTPEEFIAFSMALPFIKSPAWNKHKTEWFGRTANKFEIWYDWAVFGKEPAKPLSQSVKDSVTSVIAASDIVEMERISLLFQQNERQIKPVLYEQSLIDAKVLLMRIRDTAQNKATPNEHLNRLRIALLHASFADLHVISEYYSALQVKIDLVEGSPIYDEPSA